MASLASTVPSTASLENSPRSSPGAPAVPATQPVMVTGTISPESSEMEAPVSVSLMAWPSPAKVPFCVSAKVSVPMPAEESRTQMPAL